MNRRTAGPARLLAALAVLALASTGARSGAAENRRARDVSPSCRKALLP